MRRDPAVEARVAAAIENGGLDPGKVRPEVDTPDDAGDTCALKVQFAELLLECPVLRLP
jgi:hypothetical protein